MKDSIELYLLDANTLIDAKNYYYPIDRVPEFWDWLIYHGRSGNIKIPIEIYRELYGQKGKKDELVTWAKRAEVKKTLLLKESAEPDLVSRITYGGYLPNPTDDEIKRMGNDPFLLSYALRDPENRCVVTTEVSKKSKKGAGAKIPDVCEKFDIRCIDSFQLIRELDFKTSWNKQ